MSGSGISWAICKSAPRSWQITTPVPNHSVFYRPDALPAAQPTASKHWRHKLKNKLIFIFLCSHYFLAFNILLRKQMCACMNVGVFFHMCGCFKHYCLWFEGTSIYVLHRLCLAIHLSVSPCLSVCFILRDSSVVITDMANMHIRLHFECWY